MRDEIILVTGGAGFIGSHLVNSLVGKGYTVRVVDNLYRSDTSSLQKFINDQSLEFIEGDVRDLSCLIEASKGVSAIFHQAAVCINKSLKSPVESTQINLIGSMNVFEAARINGVKKVIFASSASVYGDPEELPMSEESPLAPITPYCAAKLALENMASYYQRFHGISYIGFRYFNVYGLGQKTDAFYTSVIILFIKRVLAGLPPLIKGDGKQSMDFVHVDDIVRANILALESKIENEILNLGTNKSTTIAQLATMILESLEVKDIIPEFSGERSLVMERRADFSKAKRLLGWEPRISVEEGLRELVLDVKEHIERY